MKWLKSIIVAIGTMILGMFGGQKEKGARRFGIFGLALTVDGFQKRSWPLVLLIPVLVSGYGHNSWLMNLIGIEFLVRMAYAFLLSLPFLFYGWKRWIVSCVLLVGVFQIHAGSLGHIAWFGDLLIEDMFRYGILGILIAFNLFFHETT